MTPCLLAICLAAGIHVHDGDTIGRGPDRVRLWGIDAPELSDPAGPSSRDHLRALIAGRPLACEDHGQDRYGRRVLRCETTDGADLGCAMIRDGQAVEMMRYSKGAYGGCDG